MAFEFAYSLDGTSAQSVTDQVLDTVANYGTGGAKKGDLVFLSGGKVRRTVATTGASLGVLEGTEFLGLIAQGQPYAATNSSFTSEAISTKYPDGMGKVRQDKSSVVYRVPVKSGQTAAVANIGQNYTISVDGNGDQTADLATQTTPCIKVVDYTKDGKFVYVTLI